LTTIVSIYHFLGCPNESHADANLKNDTIARKFGQFAFLAATLQRGVHRGAVQEVLHGKAYGCSEAFSRGHLDSKCLWDAQQSVASIATIATRTSITKGGVSLVFFLQYLGVELQAIDNFFNSTVYLVENIPNFVLVLDYALFYSNTKTFFVFLFFYARAAYKKYTKNNRNQNSSLITSRSTNSHHQHHTHTHTHTSTTTTTTTRIRTHL